MRIAVIGGVGRQESQLARIAEASGHVVEFHSGEMGGRGADELRALVARADLLLIVNDESSPDAVQLAKRLARELECASVVLARCGVARFAALLDALAVRERRALRYGS